MDKIAAALLALYLITLCLTGCRNSPVKENGVPAATGVPAAAGEPAQKIGMEYDLTPVRVRSDEIRASLEKDPLTQTELNQKSQELCELWDAALNSLLNEAEKILPEAEMEALTAEQSAWLEAKNEAAEAAGKAVEGGSMHALAVNMEAANRTEARVSELYERLK